MIITNDKLMEILERNLGLPMGDGGIFYIEDPGQKRINKIYFSKNNMQLYKCTADNTDVTVTGNYKLYSLTNSDDYIEGLTGVGRGGLKYIQDVGTKIVNNVYIDRPTGKLYRCITETTSVNNDGNFKEHTVENISSILSSLITGDDINICIGSILIHSRVIDNLEFNANSATNPTSYGVTFKRPPFGMILDWSRFGSGPAKALFHPGSGGFGTSSVTFSCSGVVIDGALYTCAQATTKAVRGRLRYIVIGEV